jgi:hypothetical protein
MHHRYLSLMTSNCAYTNMDTDEEGERLLAAENDNLALSQALQQWHSQFTSSLGMADSTDHQTMSVDEQVDRQITEARRHTYQNPDASSPASAAYHETSAHFRNLSQLPPNLDPTMQSHIPLQHPSYTMDFQDAHSQLASAQPNTQMTHDSPHIPPPPPPTSHQRMPTIQGIQRSFTEPGFMGQHAQYRFLAQPEAPHQHPLAAHNPAMQTYREAERLPNHEYGRARPLQALYPPQQYGAETRVWHGDYAQQERTAEQTRNMQYNHRPTLYGPEQFQPSMASRIPQEYNSGHVSVHDPQYQLPLQQQQYAAGQMSSQNAQYQALPPQHAAISGNVASTQPQHARLMDPRQIAARAFLDRHPPLRDWVQRHPDEYRLFSRFLQVCEQAVASIKEPCSDETRAEITTVMVVAHFQGILTVRREQMSTARQNDSIQKLAQQLLIYWIVRSQEGPGVPAMAVVFHALYVCDLDGLPFTLPNPLLQRQVPPRPQRQQPQQQSLHGNSLNPIDLTDEEVIPSIEQDSPKPSHTSRRVAPKQNVETRNQERSYCPLPTNRLPENNPQITNTAANPEQAQTGMHSAPSAGQSSWDPGNERAVDEACADLLRGETALLEQNANAIPLAELQAIQSFLDMASTPDSALVNGTTPYESQLPNSTGQTPDLASDTSQRQTEVAPTSSTLLTNPIPLELQMSIPNISKPDITSYTPPIRTPQPSPASSRLRPPLHYWLLLHQHPRICRTCFHAWSLRPYRRERRCFPR